METIYWKRFNLDISKLPQELLVMVDITPGGERQVPLWFHNIFMMNEVTLQEAVSVFMEYLLTSEEKEYAKLVGIKLLDNLKDMERLDFMYTALEYMLLGLNYREIFGALCKYLRSCRVGDAQDDEYKYPEEKMFFCWNDNLHY